MKKIENVELLAPAGDMEKLKLALLYGADAVYLGGAEFGLRASAPFNEEELKEAVKLVHEAGRRIFVTVNIFARNNDFEPLIKYLKFLEEIKVDAVIVSDLGVLRAARENTGLEVHISTQASVCNKFTAEEYIKLGAKRIILARELSLEEIKEIAQYLKGRADVEVFVHGAMCVSYSGRCLLSDYMTDRAANRGKCAQPCRYKYFVTEEKRPGELYEVEEDKHGTYIFNSKDLCLIEHLDELSEAGVGSFKIEGRMNSEYYVASVVNAYRRKMNGESDDFVTELKKTAHREFTTGFVFGEKDKQKRDSSKSFQTHEIAALCLGDGKVVQKNVFEKGDILEVLSPGERFGEVVKVKKIIYESGEVVEKANKTAKVYKLDGIEGLKPGDILRKGVED